MQNLFCLVSCDYDMLLTKINFQIMLTLARTSHRPVRYTDASGILRNADCERNGQGKKLYKLCTRKTEIAQTFFLCDFVPFPKSSIPGQKFQHLKLFVCKAETAFYRRKFKGCPIQRHIPNGQLGVCLHRLCSCNCPDSCQQFF